MAPKPVFKVHSLSKHIEETTKGLNADARGKKPAAARPSIKKTAAAAPAAGIFANNDSDSDSSSSSSSDDSDSDDNGPSFLKDLTKPKGTKRRSKDDEIADSDVERTAAASKAKPVKKTAAAPAKAKAASSSDDSSSESESESSDEEVSSNGAALKSKASSTSATSPTSSSGSDSGSSSATSSSGEDSESESESEAAPAKPVAAAKKPASKPAPAKPVESESEESSSEESESESEGESEPAPKPQKKPAANGTKATTKATPKATEPESDSSSEDDEEGSSDEEADESMQVAERAQASQIALPQFMPPDFELRKGDQQSNGQDVARVCSEANLQGKQLWYFTLPANIPVSVVENLEFPMDKSQQSGSILSHDGQDYGISFDSMAPTKSIQILIPSGDGSTYKPTHRTVDEVMQIRRITQVGATTATPAAVGSSIKVPRPQPKGLKARFQPIGVNSDMGTLGLDEDSDSSDDDVEMQDAPAESTPKASQKKDKKRKDASDPKESASKSKKSKRKHSISEDEDAAAAEQLMEESVSAVTKSKKQKTASRGSPDLGSEPTPKRTLVVPPPIPGSSAIVDAAATPAKKSRKTAAKPATPLPNSQVSSSKKETPVPVPVVPSLSKAAPAGTPADKKTKKRKEKIVPGTPE
ncbi:hypothetical protein PWT90_09571 [Aphanocladium album]|nr:hypothetical protein PWT90_09571 [Aphanocladium album]